MRGTAGEHVRDTITTEGSTTPSEGANIIGVHILDINILSSCPLRTVEEILGAHLINDGDFWGNTNPSDVSIDTRNSKEMMTGSHITELHKHKYEKNSST